MLPTFSPYYLTYNFICRKAVGLPTFTPYVKNPYVKQIAAKGRGTSSGC